MCWPCCQGSTGGPTCLESPEGGFDTGSWAIIHDVTQTGWTPSSVPLVLRTGRRHSSMI